MKLPVILGISLSAILSTCCGAGARAQAPLDHGRFEQTVDSGGLTRNFIIRIPDSVDLSKPAPLVVVLHGWTTSAKQAETYTRMSEQAAKSGFIVVFPDGLGDPKGWNAGFIDLSGKKGDDVAFVNAVLDKVEGETKTDLDRVYVCGHSNGAFMSELVGAKLGNRLAAIGIVAGTIGVPVKGASTYNTIPDPVAPVSVIAIHSRKDMMVAYDKASQALLKCVPAEDCAKWWDTRDGADATPKITANADGTVQTTLYPHGKNGTEVELITLKNGSHAWPGGYNRDGLETASGFDAAQALWDFFASHPKQR